MEFQPLATFELSETVAKRFLKTERFPIPNGFPFKEFAVLFPLSALDLNADWGKTLADSVIGQSSKYKEIVSSFLKTNVTVFLNHTKDDTIIISIHDTMSLMVEAQFTRDGKFEILKQEYAEEYSKTLLAQCLHISQGTIWHYNSPTTIKKVSELRERKSDSPVRGYKSSSKKYIYRTRYVFENATRDTTEERRAFNRKTDSWMVNGHVRRYRDADGNVIKEIYINPYKKGIGEIKKSEYKITRI